jgi:predicted dienelactone hydrolase
MRGIWFVSAAVVAAAIGTACSSSGHTTTAAPPSTAPKPAAPAIISHVEFFVDKTRSTPKYSTYRGAPTRTIRVRFYSPASGGPYPLILFSHGFQAEPEDYAPLLRDIARKGYVVAAPAYPLSSGDAPAKPTALDLSNQPKDASFVISRALKQFPKLIDPNEVGAAGQSLGGMTTYGLVFNACCRDPRIKAGAVFSGIAAGFPATYFKGIKTPLLALHGNRDETLPYAQGLAAYKQAEGPKYFVTLIGATHSSDSHGGTTVRQQAATNAIVDFFDLYLKHDPGALARLRAVAQQPGITKLISTP